MKLFIIGDICGEPGLRLLEKRLRPLKRYYGADFTIVNGENASMTGITPEQADRIFDAGADVITLGNHVWGKRQIVSYLEDNHYILRPANLAPQLPGNGFGIYEVCGKLLLVINLIGRCEMPFGPDNPFLAADRILRTLSGKYDLAVCEIHANATSEKVAMGFYLDGRCSAVWGTHTHVQTADERINPAGSGYITDIGMTGPLWSVLGIDPQQSIAMFRGDLTDRFRPADGECALGGAIFEINTANGKCVSVERVFDRV